MKSDNRIEHELRKNPKIKLLEIIENKIMHAVVFDIICDIFVVLQFSNDISHCSLNDITI